MKAPTILKTFATAIASLTIFASCIYVGDACSAGYPVREGMAHARFFGTVAVVLLFPLLVGVGFAIRFGLEFLLRRELPLRFVLPWAVPLAFSLFVLFEGLSETPSKKFTRFVSDEIPRSISDLQIWHTSGFGNQLWILAYRIAPSDLPLILNRYQYKERHESEGFRPILYEELSSEDRDPFPMRLPEERLTYEFSYSKPGPSGGLHVSHYTTEAKDFVLTIGSWD